MKHDLKTLEDILKVVNANNLDNFLTDFRGWLSLHMLVDEVRGIAGENAVVINDNTLMHWIDDGKTDAKIHIEDSSE